VLVDLAQTDHVVLRDLRSAATRCLALLSTSDALKPRLAAAGVLPLLCSAGDRPSPRQNLQYIPHRHSNIIGTLCSPLVAFSKGPA
jgi:hypothetical protein